MLELKDIGQDNRIDISDGVTVTGTVRGNNNSVVIRNTAAVSKITLDIKGDNNRFVILGGRSDDAIFYIHGNNNICEIGDSAVLKRSRVRIGNHVPAHQTRFHVGDGVTLEPGCNFLLFNSGTSVRIGDDCMFSTGITLRCGESPHLIFETETGNYLDTQGDIVIGDHCWIGERAYLTKRAGVPNGSIVAACSVVSRAFDEQNCVLAGNPAKVAKRKVSWARNRSKLPKEGRELESLDAFSDRFHEL
jgi:acetyltransferase-like isoleucine patch superfamily enzyme